MAQQKRHRKDEIVRGSPLAQFAVHARFDGHPGVEVHFIAHHRADRTKCIEALGARPLHVFLLQVAGRDVVGKREAAQHLAPIFFGSKVPCAPAYHQRQLSFEIHSFR